MENWQQVREIFVDAMRLVPEKRSEFLDQVCGANPEIRREVESLLSVHDEAGDFLEDSPLADLLAPTSALKPLRSGINFAHYEIVRKIGTGGMGEVYLAQDKKLERPVAVKILNEKFAADESNLPRFVQEAKAASALNHPNILVIHDIGEAESIHYIASEYVAGETLREILNKKRLEILDIIEIAVQIAGALVAAHAANIVHRDIKPENIIVRPDGFVKILDFGLAKLVESKSLSPPGLKEEAAEQNQTAKGIILGTVNYMSPEQAKGERVDERTDIFSLGALLYELIAGRPPFAGDVVAETLANLINKEPAPLEILTGTLPDELSKIVSKALRKNRDERYQSMETLLTDLKNLRETLAVKNHLEKSRSSKGRATFFVPRETKNIGGKTSLNFTTRLRRRQAAVAFATAALLIAALVSGYYFLTGGKQASKVKKSLAVLPFVNSSQDPNAEYLADGITESVINNLSHLSNLRVMSRNSAFRFKNNQSDTKTIAAQLGVENIVTGDIKQIGDKLIINVRLINAADDSQVWGNQYVMTSADVISTQNEIARAVAGNLRLKLTDDEREQLENRQTKIPQAYEYYLRGRFHFYKTTEPELRKAIDFFRQAIELDPNYALAYAGIGEAYRSLPMGGYAASKEAFPQAKAAAEKALEIAPDLAEAHIVLGWIAFHYEWNWELAESEFKKALELAPDNPDAHRGYGHLFSTLGRHEQAIAEIRLARELAPLTLINISLEGQFLFYGGRDEEAVAAFRKALEIDPNYWIAHNGLGRIYIRQKRYAEAVEALERARQLSPQAIEVITQLGYALAKSGNRKKALQTIEEIWAISREHYVPSYAFAIIYNGLGEREEALKYLEKSIREREVQITFIKIDTRWDELRNEPRFQDLMSRIGFPN